MDEELFGRKKDVASRKGLLNIDSLLGDPQKVYFFFNIKKSVESFMPVFLIKFLELMKKRLFIYNFLVKKVKKRLNNKLSRF